MDLSAFEWLVVSVFGVFAVVGLAVVVLLVVVATRYRHLLPSALALAGALLYGASPIDLLPEAFLGPLGVVDDVGIIGAALALFISQVRKGQAAQRDDPVTIQRLPD
jgi:uncharacterized membrane protein YkvA (DUF1232 family)